MPSKIARPILERIKSLVAHFEANRGHFELALEQLRGHVVNDRELMKYVHSLKARVKNPSHLKDKLIRKAVAAQQKKEEFNIVKENLFSKINDLAGFRILHLHTRQMGELNSVLLNRLDEALYKVIEGPIARTWDDETRKYFSDINIQTVDSERLYTSVHYIIETNSKTKYTCEIQVRTLADEIWGEVDHSINYPHPVKSIACSEQIKVLARATTACSRLVDSIFKSHESFVEQQKKTKRAR
jgi:ppGpp synthetase/RelA/SpoT-type nucleotidyltranferase